MFQQSSGVNRQHVQWGPEIKRSSNCCFFTLTLQEAARLGKQLARLICLAFLKENFRKCNCNNWKTTQNTLSLKWFFSAACVFLESEYLKRHWILHIEKNIIIERACQVFNLFACPKECSGRLQLEPKDAVPWVFSVASKAPKKDPDRLHSIFPFTPYMPLSCSSPLKHQAPWSSAKTQPWTEYFPSRIPDGISSCKRVLHRDLQRKTILKYASAVYIYLTVLSYADEANNFPAPSKLCPGLVRTIFFLWALFCKTCICSLHSKPEKGE